MSRAAQQAPEPPTSTNDRKWASHGIPTAEAHALLITNDPKFMDCHGPDDVNYNYYHNYLIGIITTNLVIALALLSAVKGELLGDPPYLVSKNAASNIR